MVLTVSFGTLKRCLTQDKIRESDGWLVWCETGKEKSRKSNEILFLNRMKYTLSFILPISSGDEKQVLVYFCWRRFWVQRQCILWSCLWIEPRNYPLHVECSNTYFVLLTWFDPNVPDYILTTHFRLLWLWMANGCSDRIEWYYKINNFDDALWKKVAQRICPHPILVRDNKWKPSHHFAT